MNERRARRRTRLQPVRGASSGRVSWLLTAVPVLLAAVVGVVTVLATAEEDTAQPSPLPDPTPVADATDEEDAEADEATGDRSGSAELELAVVDVIVVRDPFDPVVPEPEDATDGDPAAPGDPDDPDSSGSSNGTDPADPDTTDPDGTDPSRCVGETELVCGGQVVTLEEITTDAEGRTVAVIQVDDFRYVVGPGEPFAEDLELVSIEDGSVRIIFGDQVYRLTLRSAPLK